VLPRKEIDRVQQSRILDHRLTAKAHLVHADGRIHAPAQVTESVEVFVDWQVLADLDVLGREQIVAARRVHVQQVNERHRRGDRELDVEAYFDEHASLQRQGRE